jgi:hypothetical protein
VTIATAAFDRILVVDHTADRLQRTSTSGRGYGCGLLTLAPLPQADTVGDSAPRTRREACEAVCSGA